MAKAQEHKTDYRGVTYSVVPNPATRKPEKKYHIRYRTKREDGTWKYRIFDSYKGFPCDVSASFVPEFIELKNHEVTKSF